MDWIAAKLWLVDVTGLEKDALHIYAGVAAQLLAAPFFARRLASPWPLLAVLLLTLANEAYDLVFEVWPEVDRARQWRLAGRSHGGGRGYQTRRPLSRPQFATGNIPTGAKRPHRQKGGASLSGHRNPTGKHHPRAGFDHALWRRG